MSDRAAHLQSLFQRLTSLTGAKDAEEIVRYREKMAEANSFLKESEKERSQLREELMLSLAQQHAELRSIRAEEESERPA
eukprot:4604388-Prymnesium_polylepis.1